MITNTSKRPGAASSCNGPGHQKRMKHGTISKMLQRPVAPPMLYGEIMDLNEFNRLLALEKETGDSSGST